MSCCEVSADGSVVGAIPSWAQTLVVGNVSGGTDAIMSNGDRFVFVDGTGVERLVQEFHSGISFFHLHALNSGAAAVTGDSITIEAGPGGATSGAGGSLVLQGGTATDGNGGGVSISGRNGATTTATPRSGGSVTITAGNAAAGGTAGALSFVVTGGTTTVTGATALWTYPASAFYNSASPIVTVGNGTSFCFVDIDGAAASDKGFRILEAGTVRARFTTNSTIMFLSSHNAAGVLTHQVLRATPTATVTSVGGDTTLNGGPGGTTSGNGGIVSIEAGTATDGNGGAVLIIARNGATTTATDRDGGAVTITAGNAALAGTAGSVTVTAGSGGATGTAGTITITGGLGGSTSGDGGQAVMIGGSGQTEGAGGSAEIAGGTGVGTNRNGGDGNVSGGTPTGTGTAGSVRLTPGQAAGATGVEGMIRFQGGWTLDQVISPGALGAGTTNDYDPAGGRRSVVFRITPNGAGSTLGGIVPGTGVTSRVILICNVGAAALTLAHDTGGTATNRFFCPGSVNLVIPVNGSRWCWYDPTSTRWRVMGAVA